MAAIAVVGTMIGPASRFDSLDEVLADVAVHGGTDVRMDQLFPVLERLGGSLVIKDNEVDAIRLPRLSTIGDSLRLEANTATIATFPALTSVGGALAIQRHSRLLELELPALASVGGDLRITNNPSLPACQAEAIVEQLQTIGGSIDTAGNDGGASCD